MANETKPAPGGLPILNPPACRQLRSKGMYVSGAMDPSEIGMSDGHVWCNQTQAMIGPDDSFVNRESCVSGRKCFVEPV